MKFFAFLVLAILTTMPNAAAEEMRFPNNLDTWTADYVWHRLNAQWNGENVTLYWRAYWHNDVAENTSGRSRSAIVFYAPDGKTLFYHYKIREYQEYQDQNRPSYLGSVVKLRISSYFFEKRRGFWPWQWFGKFRLVSSYEGGDTGDDEEASRQHGVRFLKERYNLTTDFFWW